ncbi:response regulator [Terriglobus tenax]|uniref:response regulator n=1 Tax=Terriglobus tenax TaxID=1111115 RepID=UPI0021E0D3F0|nr:response regulator [Terriglobus tenax]
MANDTMDELLQEASVPAMVRVLLLDDEPANLLLRTAILRKNGYDCLPAATVEEANDLLDQIDVAVLDYHLGHGKFGTEVATELRRRRPEVPIIILSATLEHRFGGPEDMHLLKGYSSVDDLLNALSSLAAKRRGKPVVVDARDFFYERLSMALGNDILVQILDADGTWQYVNEAASDYLNHPREWFPGRNMFVEMPTLLRDWRRVIATVSTTRETYIDRTRRGLLSIPKPDERPGTWSILAFPMTLHSGETGVVLTARVLERISSPLSIA